MISPKRFANLIPLSIHALLAALLLIATPTHAAEPVVSFVLNNERLDMAPGDIISAQPTFDTNNMPAVGFTMSKPKARAFTDITTRGVGQKMDLFVCGKLMTQPMILSPIYGGSVMITGIGSAEEATRMAIVLKTGACEQLTS